MLDDESSLSSSAIKVVSVQPSVTIVMDDAKVFLVASSDVTLPANTHLGGFGGGIFTARKDDVSENVVPYEFKRGDRTLASNVCTCGRMPVYVENDFGHESPTIVLADSGQNDCANGVAR